MKVLLIVAALCVASTLGLIPNKEQLAVLMAPGPACIKSTGAHKDVIDKAVTDAVYKGIFPSRPLDEVLNWAGCVAEKLKVLKRDGTGNREAIEELAQAIKFTKDQTKKIIGNCSSKIDNLTPTNNRKEKNYRAYALMVCLVQEIRKLPEGKSG